MTRTAILSDIHANLEALTAVINDAEARGCNKIVCLGDVVGYNADPVACLDFIRSLGCPAIKGNHDEEAASDESTLMMNPVASSALLWTRAQLDDDRREWLRRLRLVRSVSPFTIVHSTLDQPNRWHYIINKYDALSNFGFQLHRLCFHGHTHIPKIFCYQGMQTTEFEPADFVPMEDQKYFVNVGSVGQPRDGDWRASYCIYDHDTNTVSFHRVEYDIATTQRKIIDAGLPSILADRLERGL